MRLARWHHNGRIRPRRREWLVSRQLGCRLTNVTGSGYEPLSAELLLELPVPEEVLPL